MISSGKPSNSKRMFIDKISEADVLGYYLGISSIPCLIISPFRKDTKPSLAFYSPDGIKVNYIDFGDMKDRGSMMTFLMKLWNLDYNAVVDKILKDIVNKPNNNNKCVSFNHISNNSTISKVSIHKGVTNLKCKVREWRDYDIEYWKSYGISLEWLKWAEVYPISYKFIIKDGKEMVFKADKYCYTFVEKKEGKITHKFYSPFNTDGYKWQTNHDKSVLGLWSKMPEKGKAVCICSSVKDALCLMSNLYIPCICLQGEGYPISDTAIKELKRRFIDVYICLDSDETGRTDSFKLAENTGFINVLLPPFEGGKDISDFYKVFGENQFKSFFKKLFINAREEWYNELPF